MDNNTNQRRRFIKATLSLPFIGGMTGSRTVNASIYTRELSVPEHIRPELYHLYGPESEYIYDTRQIQLKLPPIAENGAVVPLTVHSEQMLVHSMAIFAAENPNPLAAICQLRDASDLPVSLRIKVMKTSDIYVIAMTRHGLLGIKRNVKVTIGCGGG